MKIALATLAAATLIASAAAADSFTPVRLGIRVAPVARLHKALRVTVSVAADAGVLDDRFAPLRIEVRLARECGGDFQHTSGVVLLDRQLGPQPATGRAYSAVARGHGRPASYGLETACVYLEEQGDDRVFASDQSLQIDISRRCTLAAARYDRTRKRRDRRAARRACGRGVPL